MKGVRPSTPSAAICSAVFATGKSLAVAMLTPLSVACAESTTATRSSKGVVQLSSLSGFGCAAASAAMNAPRSAALIMSVLLCCRRRLHGGLEP